MDIQINANQIMDKLERKLGQKDKQIATLEVLVEMLQDELNTYKDEHTLKLE